MAHTANCNVTLGFSKGEICNCHGELTPTPVRPIDRAYEGQAHYMSKAAHSLVNMLNGLDYSTFGVADAGDLTTSFHQLIKYIEQRHKTYPVSERKDLNTNFDGHDI